jgi:hypothetical protein
MTAVGNLGFQAGSLAPLGAIPVSSADAGDPAPDRGSSCELVAELWGAASP